MSNKLRFLVFGVLLISLSSCLKEVGLEKEKYKEIDTKAIEKLNEDQNLGLSRDITSGLYFKKVKENPSARLVDFQKDEVLINYKITNFAGITLAEGLPTDTAVINFNFSEAFIGFFDAMRLLKEQEKGIFYITSDLAYQDQPITGLKDWEPIILELELVRILDETKQIAFYYERRKRQPEILQANGLGMNYVTKIDTAQGLTGKETVGVNYKGSFLNGYVFDSGTLNVNLGNEQVVEGFEQAILLLKKGERAIFTFPSALGYKDTGSTLNSQGIQTIPGYTPLSFEIELVSIQ